MRPHYEAIGTVAAAAVANGDTIINSFDIPSNERGQLGLHIKHRGKTFRVNIDPPSEYINAVVGVRLSQTSGIDTTAFPPATEARRVLFVDNDIDQFDGTFHVLEQETDNPNSDPQFDGVRVIRPLYPYESEFTFRDYREMVSDIIPRMDEGLSILQEKYDIDLTQEEFSESKDEAAESAPSFY